MISERQNGLKQVGECLNRHHSETYYALVKIAGKQIKRSLRSAAVALANHAIAVTIMIVFLFVGLWHGTGWNYAVLEPFMDSESW